MCIQLQSTYNTCIDINKPILFDKYILNLGNDIIYEDGYFYLNCNGTYYISWWVSVLPSSLSCNVSFKIRSCKGHNIEGCSSHDSSQVCGDAIVNVENSHLKFALVNNSKSSIILSYQCNIKANISIYKISPDFNYIAPNSKYKSIVYINKNYVNV